MAGPTADPDTERLLEGVAFLTGLLNQKLDDEFPELIHGLMEIIFPHYLRPVPSISIVAFSPRPGLRETVSVPAGTTLSSIPVEETACRFRTCFDVEVHPLELRSVEAKTRGDQLVQISMVMKLSGINLAQWQPRTLPFMLGGPISQAADICFLLTRHLERIVIEPTEDGGGCVLPPDCLRAVGFDPDTSILPFPMQSFSGYRLIQEYFLLPAKLLFIELKGWEDWQDRGAGTEFRVTFEFSRAPIPLSRVTSAQVILFATPVINLFGMEAEPVTLDHRTEKVRVLPEGRDKSHFQIYSVEKVVGHVQGSLRRKDYLPLEVFSRSTRDNLVYQVVQAYSPIDGTPQVFLSFPYSRMGPEPETEVLSIELICTNGTLPERLELGDISVATDESPGLLSFRNIMPPTYAVDPPLGKKTLWKLLGHLSLNYLPLVNTANLKDMLMLYAFPEGRNRAMVTANLRQIEGIIGVYTEPIRRLIRGAPMYGQNIEVTAEQDHFASMGALYLFGSVLDQFFGVYSSMHTFTRFQIKEPITGETFTWPERMGTKWLI